MGLFLIAELRVQVSSPVEVTSSSLKPLLHRANRKNLAFSEAMLVRLRNPGEKLSTHCVCIYDCALEIISIVYCTELNPYAYSLQLMAKYYMILGLCLSGRLKRVL